MSYSGKNANTALNNINIIQYNYERECSNARFKNIEQKKASIKGKHKYYDSPTSITLIIVINTVIDNN